MFGFDPNYYYSELLGNTVVLYAKPYYSNNIIFIFNFVMISRQPLSVQK